MPSAVPTGSGSPEYPQGGILGLCWSKYIKELHRRPLRTKCITSACVAGLGDVLAQLIASGSYSSLKRTLALACFGFLYTGPSAHYWQKFMELLCSGKTDVKTVTLKVLIDQLTYGPVCNMLFMLFAAVAMEGRPLAAVLRNIPHEFPAVQLDGWQLWPLATLINYRFVPLQFRVLFMNLVALLWTVFLLLRARGSQGRGRAGAGAAVKAGK
ncbi:hypothetical protein Agub_g9895 [Astrephomene gubernaculifera]|uniref:Peroxisomal membrane protein MPV17 n=1 Tax=Astrephomene gubernaculifera TaxID=47775 RepID=A0AAD3DTZ3_9CHLO|nr:hypothetical protein Agub_g9895 [Astrephomene gubernaculifera]